MVDVRKTEHRRSYFKAHTTVDRVQLARLATDSGVIRKKASSLTLASLGDIGYFAGSQNTCLVGQNVVWSSVGYCIKVYKLTVVNACRQLATLDTTACYTMFVLPHG